MKIPGTSINISRTPKPLTPATVVRADSANNYQDSVAGALASRFPGSTIKSNGRTINKGYSAAEIEEIYQGYIFAAIKKIAGKTAEVLTDHIEIVDENNDEVDGARHPYQDAIDAATMDNTLFFKGIATYVVVLGEAFVDAGLRTMVAGNIKASSAFNLLQSNRVTRTYDDAGELKTYKLTDKLPNGLDKVEHYLPSNVIAITDLNPWDLRKGYGMMRPIVDKIALESMATKLQIATLSNSIKAPGVLSSKEKLEGDDYQELKNQVETRYTSNDMDKAGVPIVTNGGFIDYTSLLEDLDKLAMLKIRNMNRDSFFAALGVSKTILGIEESGVTRDTSRVMTENFILDQVMPLANSILNAFNQDYINNYPVDYAKNKLKMRAIAPIEKDLEQEKGEADIAKLKAETFKTLIDAGVDPEQATVIAGIELKDDAKITMVVKPEPKNTITLTEEQLKLITNSGKTEPSQVIINQNKGKEVHQHDPKEIAEIAKNSLSPKESQKIVNAEIVLTEKLRELDGNLGEQYAKSVNQIDTKTQETYTADVAEALAAYYTVAVPIFGNARAALTAADFEKDLEPFIYNDAVKQIIRERLAKVANGHFATIDKELTEVINDSIKSGATREATVRAVQEAVNNNVVRWEVDRLVQTETSNAFNQSTYFSDKQFVQTHGYTGKAYKVWRTNSAKPCPFCTALNGTRVPLESNFKNVGDVAEGETTTADGKNKQVFYPVRFVDVNAGGLHPNCHCDYQLVIE